MPLLRYCLLFACAGLLAGCGREPPPAPTDAVKTQTVASPEEGGAVSRAPMAAPPAQPPAAPVPAAAVTPVGKAPDWSPLELSSGQAWIDCGLDYRHGDGETLTVPSRANLRHLLEPCLAGDALRLRYRGKVASDFTALVERVTRVADSLGIGSRVLDLDSTGGQVEDAIRVGDWIGANRWTIWVREDSVCHSACVFVLAGGDSRRLAGQVGIHRIIRLSSTATSRTELNTELQAVYATVREYLERNGASPLLADVMKTVPNRSLRLLDKCGDDFMRRRDAWVRAFDEQCREQGQVHALNTCGLQLRRDFGFPDDDCPAESPLAEFNELPEGPPADAPVAAPVGVSATGAVEAPAVAAEPVPSDAARVDEGQGG